MIKMKAHLAVMTVVGLVSTTVSPAFADQAQAYGAIFGSLLGGIVGSSVARGNTQILTTTTGVLMGGYVGSEIGQAMNQPQSTRTSNPGTLNSLGSVDTSTLSKSDYTPNYVAPPALSPASITPAFNEASKLCRPYPQTLTINNQIFVRTGLLCLEKDGQWHVAQ